MLEWNVYVEDFNRRKITTYNIFEHAGFLESCKKVARKYKNDREIFEKEIKSWLMYCFWSKCEWEIILSSWPERKGFREEKIDVYDQVSLNWSAFINYVWEHAPELRRREKKG